MRRAFLEAEWRYLAMINYAIDPRRLARFVPAGLELDFFNGTTFVSVVGFRFLSTKVLGLAVPFHRDFEEVNLRFYVRRRVGEEYRRGVVFIRELVPRRAIALVARRVYGEPYSAVPMRHRIQHAADRVEAAYQWRREGRWESMRVTASGAAELIAPGSIEEFITEHYWGYTARSGGCAEYEVQHPRWRVWHGTNSVFDADVSTLYGEEFVDVLGRAPVSAFIAEGSAVSVRTAASFASPSLAAEFG